MNLSLPSHLGYAISYEYEKSMSSSHIMFAKGRTCEV